MTYLVSFKQIATLLTMILLGVVGRRKGLIGEACSKSMVNLLIYFTLPALILHSTNLPTSHALSTGVLAAVLGLVIRFFSLLVGQAIGKVARWEAKEQAIFTFQMTFGNAGFIGLPICYALYGEQGSFLGALFNLSHEFLFWTLGIWLVSKKSNGDWRNFLNPPGIASVLGLILFGAGIRLPEFFSSLFGQLGAATTPLAMLLVGSQLRFAAASRRQWLFLVTLCLFRLLIVPVGVFYLLSQFALPKILIQVATIITAMPASTMLTVIAAQVGSDAELASATTLVTTVCAAFTIPLIIALVS
ncbi:MAG TPA: AEC family transporter [Bacillota bacterium]|jgi:predicted permease|nr:AEC family transporter [Bacillota bacterium]HQD40010.1 AEC family transporter [Bacillota bacterium]